MATFLHKQVGNKKALVTMAIGQTYQDLFDQHAKNTFLAYCKKFKYDLVCITEALDQSERARQRSPAWQKLLVLSQPWSSDYTQILWLDTDIIINNNNATDIAEDAPLHKVSAVDQYVIPTKELYRLAFERYYLSRNGEIPAVNNLSPSSYYKNHGLDGAEDLAEVMQTGVWLASPIHHKAVFEEIYYGYEDVNHTIIRDQYEMPAMSLELVKNHQVNWIQYQFNFDVMCHMFTYYPHVMSSTTVTPSETEGAAGELEELNQIENERIRCLNNLYQLSIFMHFNGCHQIMIDYSKYIAK